MTDIIKKIFYLLPKGDSIKVAILFAMMLFAAFLEIAGIGMIPAFVAVVAVPERVLEYELIQPVLSYLNIINAEDLLIWGSVGLLFTFLIKSLYVVFFGYIES